MYRNNTRKGRAGSYTEGGLEGGREGGRERAEEVRRHVYSDQEERKTDNRERRRKGGKEKICRHRKRTAKASSWGRDVTWLMKLCCFLVVSCFFFSLPCVPACLLSLLLYPPKTHIILIHFAGGGVNMHMHTLAGSKGSQRGRFMACAGCAGRGHI